MCILIVLLYFLINVTRAAAGQTVQNEMMWMLQREKETNISGKLHQTQEE